MKKVVSWKHEWHLYSATAVTASLTFIVFQFSSGRPQAIGVAFSALVATFLFTSNSWKLLPEGIHQWVIFLSAITSVAIGFILYLFTNKEIIKRQ